MREAIAGLRSRVDERGLVPALRDYLDEFEERHGIQVALEADPAAHVPDLVGLHLFRIVQEALAKVRKHARARRAWVRLRPGPRRLELEVGDDGVGFDPARATRSTPRSFGLASMRERAEALGGELRIESGPGAGTRVAVSIPLAPHSGKGEAKDAPLASAAG